MSNTTTESIPRPEHPRPQFERADWLNLNGKWSFTFDFGCSGHAQSLFDSKGFDREILVPFCPESSLSGVGHTDFIPALWYHRRLAIPAGWRDKRVILHFGAVDWASQVFIDGSCVGEHFGGAAGFEIDVSDRVRAGETHELVVSVRDDVRSHLQPAGKQSPQLKSFGCFYTRVTGIWQTVWIEAMDRHALETCHIAPNLDAGSFSFTPVFHALKPGLTLRTLVKDGGAVVASRDVVAAQAAAFEIALPAPKSWSPTAPFLYDIEFQVLDRGTIIDSVNSYAGLRKIHISGDRIFLNNAPLYQRLVLDQGFYPDGIWTAPSDAALKNDIMLSLQAGFNGARLHQKVFEERFHYWADRLGYLTWAEFPDWGCEQWGAKPQAQYNFLAEWREVVLRDRNHPSIITWTPHNETHNRQVTDWSGHNRFVRDTVNLTRQLDPTRPINDCSGYIHVCTDIWTVHNYSGDAAQLHALLNGAEVWRNYPDLEPAYAGQPYIVDEFGGARFVPGEQEAAGTKRQESWGYGQNPRSAAEFLERVRAQVDALLRTPRCTGYCYTQLTDVEQEQNGLYRYDRTPKLPVGELHAIFSRDPISGS